MYSFTISFIFDFDYFKFEVSGLVLPDLQPPTRDGLWVSYVQRKTNRELQLAVKSQLLIQSF